VSYYKTVIIAEKSMVGH